MIACLLLGNCRPQGLVQLFPSLPASMKLLSLSLVVMRRELRYVTSPCRQVLVPLAAHMQSSAARLRKFSALSTSRDLCANNLNAERLERQPAGALAVEEQGAS